MKVEYSSVINPRTHSIEPRVGFSTRYPSSVLPSKVFTWKTSCFLVLSGNPIDYFRNLEKRFYWDKYYHTLSVPT